MSMIGTTGYDYLLHRGQMQCGGGPLDRGYIDFKRLYVFTLSLQTLVAAGCMLSLFCPALWHSFPLPQTERENSRSRDHTNVLVSVHGVSHWTRFPTLAGVEVPRSEEHTSELQSL